MASLPLLAAVYLLGGLTFVPLLLLALLAHAYFTLPEIHANAEIGGGAHSPENNDTEDSSPSTDLPPIGSDDSKSPSYTPDVAAGYFAVCREYVPGGVNGKPPERVTPAGAVVAVESPSVYQTMYRSLFDRNKSATPSIDNGPGKGRKGRNVFYVVLRHAHLMLYDDSEQLEVRHVISLAHYNVDVYAGGGSIPEGELWIKRNCIRLTQQVRLDELGDTKPFYFFSENCSDKEDFYHAMLQSKEQRANSFRKTPTPLIFDKSDLVKLVQQLHASEENLNTRWINALIGRLFLSLYKTSDIEQFIWTKITKKIARVPKPALIKTVHVQNVVMGNLPPFITNPKLKDLTVDGALTIEADISYKGNFRLDVCAIARIDFGPRFKAREVTLVLASILKRLEGHILIKIKPPPSNRIWVTFESAPKMEFSLEPIVSTRQITYGVILRAIESRIREVVNETLVLPNWDDIPFADTISQQFRGGIWKDDQSKEKRTDLDIGSVEQPASHGRHDSEDSELQVPQSASVDTIPAMSSLQNSGQLASRRHKEPTTSRNDTKTIGASSSVDVGALANQSGSQNESTPTASIPAIDVDADYLDGTTEENEFWPDDDAVAAAVTAAAATAITKGNTPSTGTPSSANSPRGSSTPSDEAQNRVPRKAASFGSQETSRSGRKDSTADANITFDTISLSQSSDPHRFDSNKRNSKAKHESPSSSTEQIPTTVTRRATLNQSLNSATAVAKQWLSSMQSPSSSPAGSPGLPPPDEASIKSMKLSGASGGDKVQPPLSKAATTDLASPMGSPIHPMGRGQPLPPPGTPLPFPKSEKRGAWTLPSASTLANLTRRKPAAEKDGSAHRDIDTDSPRQHRKSVSVSDTTLLQASHGEHEKTSAPQPTHRRRSSATSSTSRTFQPGGSSTMPRRRPRHSISENPEGIFSSQGGVLVVEAPLLETSAPTSPSIPDYEGLQYGWDPEHTPNEATSLGRNVLKKQSENKFVP